MSNNLNLSDSINFAISSGKTPTFRYNDSTYEFSPEGLLAFISAEATPPYTIPMTDPLIKGLVWNDAGVLRVSEGPEEEE